MKCMTLKVKIQAYSLKKLFKRETKYELYYKRETGKMNVLLKCVAAKIFVDEKGLKASFQFR